MGVWQWKWGQLSKRLYSDGGSGYRVSHLYIAWSLINVSIPQDKIFEKTLAYTDIWPIWPVAFQNPPLS
jgi:hypothetical protein